MDYLHSFPADERAARYDEVAECSIYDYSGWLLDRILSYGGDYPDEVTRIADTLAEIDTDNAANFQGDVPFALVQAGRRDEALERIQSNLRRFPEDIWTQIRTGDVYEELGEQATALEFYISALKMASDPSDWDAVLDRTTELLQKMGRAGDWAQIKRENPCPVEPPTIRRAARQAPPSLPFRSGPKIGPNEPCPCGSGKKYKKCCRLKTYRYFVDCGLPQVWHAH
jgi:tetratricopeptide (TPR) repeat protein